MDPYQVPIYHFHRPGRIPPAPLSLSIRPSPNEMSLSRPMVADPSWEGGTWSMMMMMMMAMPFPQARRSLVGPPTPHRPIGRITTAAAPLRALEEDEADGDDEEERRGPSLPSVVVVYARPPHILVVFPFNVLFHQRGSHSSYPNNSGHVTFSQASF